MTRKELNFEISHLGECRIPSPMTGVDFVDNDRHVLYHAYLEEIQPILEAGKTPPYFELAGPRRMIYFDPSKMKCGIVTCGGLCPGLNDVIRAIVMSLFYHYGVQTVFGFRYGYQGLIPKYKLTPIELTPHAVLDIHEQGGSILGSSRGPQDVSEMVDTLDRMNVGLLFTIGGDGTLRGARDIAEEVKKRKLKISVIGVPKTIDNDIAFVQQSFGFETAVSEATKTIYSANVEAEGVFNGIGLVKLMGRYSGFIAAYASLAHSDVNFCLIPEVPFTLEGLLCALKKRLAHKTHAVIVVGEGAGQDLLEKTDAKDASGNVKLADIGLFLKTKIADYFKDKSIEVNLRYIDPSYTIRSRPANPHDSVFCLQLGHNAVHAGMSGRTNMLVGNWRNKQTHIPIPMAVSGRETIDPQGRLWSSVIEATGQPRDMTCAEED
jgi:6-phosphofructokinase 1